LAAPRAAIAAASRYGSQASTRQEKARRKISAVRVPTWPMPTSPTVRPRSSRPISALRSRARPARIAACASGIRFSSASIMPTACSATPSALPPAWFTSSTPAAVQAAGSTVS
jgi:hypothetical protein